MIEKLDAIKGDESKIVIDEYHQSSKEELTVDNVQKLIFELPEHTLVHVTDASG